ncbi:MAG: cupin domain-containing protein [Candidatus Caldarchaeum sp.]
MDKKSKVIHPWEIASWQYGYKSAPEVWPDDRIRVKLLFEEKIDGSRGLRIGIAELDSGDIHYMHHHEKEAEFYYVLHGKGKIIVDDETIPACPGTCVFIPPNTKHKVVNDEKETLVILFGFNTEYIEPPVWDEEPMTRYNKKSSASKSY